MIEHCVCPFVAANHLFLCAIQKSQNLQWKNRHVTPCLRLLAAFAIVSEIVEIVFVVLFVVVLLLLQMLGQ